MDQSDPVVSKFDLLLLLLLSMLLAVGGGKDSFTMWRVFFGGGCGLSCGDVESKTRIDVDEDDLKKIKSHARQRHVTPSIGRIKKRISGAHARPIPSEDENVARCAACSVSFTLIFERKHRCRRCLRVYCSSCSTFRDYVEASGPSKQRICDLCVGSFQQEVISEWNDFIDEPQSFKTKIIRPPGTNSLLSDIDPNEKGKGDSVWM